MNADVYILRVQGPNFEFLEKDPGSAPFLKGVFAYNYSALASLGLSASALSGLWG